MTKQLRKKLIIFLFFLIIPFSFATDLTIDFSKIPNFEEGTNYVWWYAYTDRWSTPDCYSIDDDYVDEICLSRMAYRVDDFNLTQFIYGFDTGVFYQNSSAISNQPIFIMGVKFKEELLIQNTSYVYIDANNTELHPTAKWYGSFVFKDYPDDDCLFVFDNGLAPTYKVEDVLCDYTTLTDTETIVNVNNGQLEFNNKTRIPKTQYFTALNNSYSFFTPDYMYFSFTWSDSGSNDLMRLWQVTLGNITAFSSNELPVCNVTLDQYQKCIGNTAVTFDLNITCDDAESDTVYYSQKDFYEKESVVNYYQNFDDYTALIDESFLTNETNLYTNGIEGALCIADFIDTPCITLVEVDNNKKLYAQKGVQEFGFYSPVMITNATDIYYELGLISDIVVDVEYWSIAPEFILKFNFTGTNLSIYANDVLKYNAVKSNYTSKGENELTVNSLHIGNNGYETFIYNDDTLISAFNTSASADFQFIDFINYNTYGHLAKDYFTVDSIRFNGWDWKRQFDWQTSYSDISVNTADSFQSVVYITDSVHLGVNYTENYVYYSTYIGGDCSQITNQTLENNFIGVTKYMLGNPIINFLKINNAYEQGKSAMWLVYLIALVMACAVVFQVTSPKQLMLVENNMVVSFSLGFVSVLLAYTINAVSFFVLASISLAIILRREQIG